MTHDDSRKEDNKEHGFSGLKAALREKPENILIGQPIHASCAGCGKVLDGAKQVYLDPEITLLYCWDCGENLDESLVG